MGRTKLKKIDHKDSFISKKQYIAPSKYKQNTNEFNEANRFKPQTPDNEIYADTWLLKDIVNEKETNLFHAPEECVDKITLEFECSINLSINDLTDLTENISNSNFDANDSFTVGEFTLNDKFVDNLEYNELKCINKDNIPSPIKEEEDNHSQDLIKAFKTINILPPVEDEEDDEYKDIQDLIKCMELNVSNENLIGKRKKLDDSNNDSQYEHSQKHQVGFDYSNSQNEEYLKPLEKWQKIIASNKRVKNF